MSATSAIRGGEAREEQAAQTPSWGKETPRFRAGPSSDAYKRTESRETNAYAAHATVLPNRALRRRVGLELRVCHRLGNMVVCAI